MRQRDFGYGRAPEAVAAELAADRTTRPGATTATGDALAAAVKKRFAAYREGRGG
jgi:hypothetical protein